MTIVSQNSAFYTPTEREIRKIHFFMLIRRPIRYIRRRRNGERARKKEEKKERDKLGKIIRSRLFVRLTVVYVEEGTEKERDREKSAKIIVSLISVTSVRRISPRRYHGTEIGENHSSIAFSLSRSSSNVEKDFHKLSSKVAGIEESESVISLSKLLT